MGVLDISCKSEPPPQEPEVRVDIDIGGGDWIRIPVVSSELWISKDGPAAINRTAKIKFPAEWGGRDITADINALQAVDDDTPADPFDRARMFHVDHDTNAYHIAHFGYVGGIGPAAEDGVMKMWIYDPADLMRRTRVSKSFGRPTIQQVLQFVVSGTDEQGRDVGLETTSVFENVRTYVAGIQEIKQQKRLEEEREDEVEETLEDGFRFLLDNSLPVAGAFQLEISDLVGDIFDWAKDNVIDPLLTGQRRFQLNRDNMVDLMDWFAAEVGGKWHFEPTPTGPVLFFDNTSSKGATKTLTGAEQREDGEITRRRFVERETVLADTVEELEALDIGDDITNFRDRGAFDIVTTLDNQALWDIKPINSLTLYGETHDPAQYRTALGGKGLSQAPEASAIGSSRFPKVEVRHQELIDRAGGFEYGPPAIESDKISLDQAKREAIKEFRSYLNEATEGNITIKGNPFILPYDYITTIPVCNGTYPNVDAPTMTYEVHSVKHTRSWDSHYTSELDVSLVLDETTLDVEAEYIDA